MRPWHNLRVLAEARFVLGAGAGGCLVGALASLLVPPFPWVADPVAPAVRTIVRVAHGVGLGWWAGIFWGLFAALLARAQKSPPPVDKLPPLGLAAAAVALVALALARLGELPTQWGVLGALALALVGTRVGLALTARDHR
ncbi:MAG: hypothetical protein ACP5NF_11150 [Thermoanaerobaculum sp.]